MPRIDGRNNDQLRPTTITPGYSAFAEGSALVEVGLTRVVCTATLEDRVPFFLKGTGRGWITAEYGMLPRSTLTRSPRERNGRTHEIQRLIGRSLRAVADMSTFRERTFTVDCDVLQADGGTRVAAITGAYVALYQAMLGQVRAGVLASVPLRSQVAGVSVGVVGGEEMLDLCYDEDSRAGVDFNVVMTAQGHFVEVQGTAEAHPFPRLTLESLLNLAEKGIKELFIIQKQALKTLHA